MRDIPMKFPCDTSMLRYSVHIIICGIITNVFILSEGVEFEGMKDHGLIAVHENNAPQKYPCV